jgi:ADP-ribosylation factor GTPase-activating protein 1
MVDPKAAAVFSKQQEDPENNMCCDSGDDGAVWTSISHGIYLSIGAAGLHRSLGVKVSFVQSTTMDSWRPLHLRMMELGGNRRFQEFMREHGIPDDMPIREKYSTHAAKWYRENLKALAEESQPPAPLPEGTGHLPSEDRCSSEQKVLDRIFAAQPRGSSMTSGGVLKQHIQQNTLPQRIALKSEKGKNKLFSALAKVEQLRSSQSAPAALDRSSDRAVPNIEEFDPSRKRTRSASATPRAVRCLAPNLTSLGLEKWWPSLSLQALASSSNCPTADRLQTMSTGKMEGFGSDSIHDPLPCLLAKTTALPDTKKAALAA